MEDTYWQVLSLLIDMYEGVVKIYLYVYSENYVFKRFLAFLKIPRFYTSCDFSYPICIICGEFKYIWRVQNYPKLMENQLSDIFEGLQKNLR